jgi:hypothetical protein
MNIQQSLLGAVSALSFMNPFGNFLPKQRARARSINVDKTRNNGPADRRQRLLRAATIGDILQSAIGDLHPATGSVPKTYAVSVRPSKEAYAAAETRYRARMIRRVERWFRANPDAAPADAPGHLRDWV